MITGVDTSTAAIDDAEPIRLTGLSREEMTALMARWGERPFRARQLWSWLYVKLADDVAAMTDLSKVFRDRLATAIQPLRPEVIAHRQSGDGTQKWLLAFEDGARVETVYIPEPDRGTLCVSSQVGCALACPFCQTGTQKLTRNLKAAEIVEQVTFARAALARQDRRLTNVVLMGMGEPLYNYEAVVRAVRIMLDGTGLAIGSRKITLSTAGVVPRLEPVGRDLGVNLAISLHSVRDAVRDRLVPLNKKHDLAALRRAAMVYPLKGGRRITWEYVMLAGVNDSETDARELVAWLKGIPSKVNLLPFNPWPGAPFTPSSMETILRFQEIVGGSGLVTVIRDSRGADIEAACGQLKGVERGTDGQLGNGDG